MWNLISVEGLNKDAVSGICAVLAKPIVRINKDSRHDLGYKVKLSIDFRGDMFLLSKLQRVFTQNGIYSTLKESESKVRPRPILRIGRIDQIRNFQEVYLQDALDETNIIYSGKEDSKETWLTFLLILINVESKKHLTAKGLDEIFRLKGLIE